MKNQKIIILILFVFLGLNSFSQRKADIVIPFEQNIETILLNPLTGGPIRNKDIKTKYISYIEDWSDRILIAHSSGSNFFLK